MIMPWAAPADCGRRLTNIVKAVQPVVLTCDRERPMTTVAFAERNVMNRRLGNVGVIRLNVSFADRTAKIVVSLSNQRSELRPANTHWIETERRELVFHLSNLRCGGKPIGKLDDRVPRCPCRGKQPPPGSKPIFLISRLGAGRYIRQCLYAPRPASRQHPQSACAYMLRHTPVVVVKRRDVATQQGGNCGSAAWKGYKRYVAA